ncbi:hypothetical protein [Hymenobacter sp. 102]|uniref:hypothetical protein n=1 Tax=Hymenobacter sp. 102 TaxID=3403152 RepID=UPI003CEA8834
MAFGTLAIQSCETEENEPDIPYYKFTATNKEWLKLKNGESWVFETTSGKQQKYIIHGIKEKIKEAYHPSNFGGIISGASSATYYYDEVEIEIMRTDSVNDNLLVFRRELPTGADKRHPPKGEGEFKFGGTWRNYRGSGVYEGIYGNINVSPNQVNYQSGTTLQVRGKVYNNVIAISATPNGTEIQKAYIDNIYYAQQAGVIRMVSKTGEIWDRVP